MNEEEIGIYKLELIEKLMDMYTRGTGKDADHKNEHGKYEVVEFIKFSQPLLKAIGVKITLENNFKFVENFIECLFKHARKDDE